MPISLPKIHMTMVSSLILFSFLSFIDVGFGGTLFGGYSQSQIRPGNNCTDVIDPNYNGPTTTISPENARAGKVANTINKN
ncbi:MAG: hypothetical protein COA79_16145 [Planctomycetota bacterium]|nr:MAG: hypothetical protein COA79_16145 [Planctomycetota bacterium]